MSKSVNDIHDDLLGQISDVYQKTEGFPVWDILKAVAFGIKALWDKAFYVESMMDVDNLTGDLLERFVSQRKGITRKEATYAVGTITVKTGEGTITEGDVFSTKGGVQFKATETVECKAGDAVAIQALEAGEAGNVPMGAICQMPVTIAGIAEIINEDNTADGYEAETDDSMRERYYEALREPATSGNIYHYRRWAREVSGVQSVKVFPLWKGDNTVQVVIIDDESKPASEELVARVQDYIDPESKGTGEGEAPIGAYCTVSPAEVFTINVVVSVLPNVDMELVQERVEANLTKYLKDIAFVDDYVSVAKINNVIITTEGVSDCDGLKVNGSTTRLAIPEKAVALLGEVTLNEITE